MNTILQYLPQIALAVIAFVALAALLVSMSKGFRQRHALLQLCNVAEGTHAGSIRKLTDAAVATRNLLCKHGSDGDHVAACGASDIPFGTMTDEAAAAEGELDVEILGITPRTLLMVASEAITVGEAVYTAANGKIQDLPAGAGTYYKVGHAMTAAGADGDLVEVQHCAPIATVVE
jgi:hypothetical protein